MIEEISTSFFFNEIIIYAGCDWVNGQNMLIGNHYPKLFQRTFLFVHYVRNELHGKYTISLDGQPRDTESFVDSVGQTGLYIKQT